jgi:Colicin immunity protein / pyocin immunity protein
MRRDLTREQLVELVRRIIAVDGSMCEVDGFIAVLQANVPHPSVSDLIFWPERGERSAEEIVDEALAYKPIAL